MDLLLTTDGTTSGNHSANNTINQLKQDLTEIWIKSNIRGLRQSAKWASELLHSSKSVTEIRSALLTLDGTTTNEMLDRTFEHHRAMTSEGGVPSPLSFVSNSFTKLQKTTNTSSTSGCSIWAKCDPTADIDYLFAKSIFDLGEYVRAAFLLKNQINTSAESRFLYFYSVYLGIEKSRQDSMVEPSTLLCKSSTMAFMNLRKKLQNLFTTDSSASSDAYMHYLYGIILLKLNMDKAALEALCKSVTLDPLCWCAWHQLTQVIKDEETMLNINAQLPYHWIRSFFSAALLVELQMNDEAVSMYEDLLLTFPKSNYLRAQLAIAKHNQRQVDAAIELFESIRKADPYRLEAMDIYSNLLYVKEKQAELSSLSHVANAIDPYRVETCLCIANFYSLRGQHAKSVVYFSRALHLNPKHLSAWTLMGHEYVEMKNTSSAIQAYRSALRCNKQDFRAWYGLGQTYEILKMYSYSLYYYHEALFLKPNDIRLITAIGQVFEKLNRNEEAANCYAKAGSCCLVKLANLYIKMDEEHKAAAAYNELINQVHEQQQQQQSTDEGEGKMIGQQAALAQLNIQPGDISAAYKYLANYFFKHKKFKQCQAAAQVCMFSAETRDEAKELLAKLESLMGDTGGASGTDVIASTLTPTSI